LLMLGASRRAYEGQEMVRTGTWKLSSPVLLGWQLTGKVLGILGMGRVGRAVAQRGRGFGMTIHYSNAIRLPAELEKEAVFQSSASDLLRVSESLSLNALATPETDHFINSKTIDLLPHGAILINTARGGMVVDEDLMFALKSGRVAASGLDVFEGEPKLHPGHVALKNTFLLPHMGSDGRDAFSNGHACPRQHRCGSGRQACALACDEGAGRCGRTLFSRLELSTCWDPRE
jgi:lactate dehydrogenase-like 2-hydroxyacid dehydrogenase